jgi:diaminopimelate decarboxylase
MSLAFRDRLEPGLEAIADHFGTPFYLYDATGIDQQATEFAAAFAGIGSREFFPVKALPNPAILERLRAHGFGFDCGSPTDLALALRVGASGPDIIYTSNNTDLGELRAALDAGALLTIDDEATLDLLCDAHQVPSDLLIRINPGARAPRYATPTFRTAQEAKFGVPTDRLLDVCRRALRAGVRRVGLHMMISSNWLDSAPARCSPWTRSPSRRSCWVNSSGWRSPGSTSAEASAYPSGPGSPRWTSPRSARATAPRSRTGPPSGARPSASSTAST